MHYSDPRIRANPRLPLPLCPAFSVRSVSSGGDHWQLATGN